MMIMRGKYLLAGIVASTLLLGACDLNIHLPGGNNDSSEINKKLRRVIIKTKRLIIQIKIIILIMRRI